MYGDVRDGISDVDGIGFTATCLAVAGVLALGRQGPGVLFEL